jgi:hypothetical protein
MRDCFGRERLGRGGSWQVVPDRPESRAHDRLHAILADRRDKACRLADVHRASTRSGWCRAGCGLIGASGLKLRLKRAQRRCDKA